MAIIKEIRASITPSNIFEYYDLRLQVFTENKHYTQNEILPPQHLASMYDRIFDKVKIKLLEGLLKGEDA
jgi:hypothetical protein